MGHPLIMGPSQTLIIENFLPLDIFSKIENNLSNSREYCELYIENTSPVDKEIFIIDLKRTDDLSLSLKYFYDESNKILEKNYEKKIVNYKGRSLQKYTTGTYIVPHDDYSTSTPANKENIFGFMPILSSIYFINDNYEGGEICFGSYCDTGVGIEFFEKSNMAIKPKKNTLIIFDSKKNHWTTPIVSGVKYSFISFYDVI